MQLLPLSPTSAGVPSMPAPIGTGMPGAVAGPTLRDIHMPADPSWWPPAPGWWVLALLLVLAALMIALLQRRQRRRRQWRSRVLLELDQAVLRFQQGGDRHRLAGELHALLRRAAASLDPAAASARGKDWIAVIDRIRVEQTVRTQLLALDQSMYQRDGGADFEPEQSIVAVRTWLTVALRKLAAEHAGQPRRSL